MKVKVVMLRRAKGGYLAHVPAVPGLVSEGSSKRAALRNMRRNIELYFDTAEFADRLSAKRKIVAEVTI